LAMSEPPEDAHIRPDGSCVKLDGANHILRWTRRGNGSWRKAERFPMDDQQMAWIKAEIKKGEAERAAKEEEERIRKEEEERAAAEARKKRREQATTPAAVAAAKAAAVAAAASTGLPDAAEIAQRVAKLMALREPPEDAVPQADGSFQIILEDSATLRWTKRPDGTWRKPEHRRAGWVGDLEQAKYAPPPVRQLEEIGISSSTRAVLRGLDDDDYCRQKPLRPGPVGGGYASSTQKAEALTPELWPSVGEANSSAKPKAKASGSKPAASRSKKADAAKEDANELLPALTRLMVANRWQ